jgi:hypothetical protein
VEGNAYACLASSQTPYVCLKLVTVSAVAHQPLSIPKFCRY